MNCSVLVSPAGSACSCRSYKKVPNSADVSVSCDTVSLGSSGRHWIGNSALPLGWTVNDGGTATSGLATLAVKATGSASGLCSGSMCVES